VVEARSIGGRLVARGVVDVRLTHRLCRLLAANIVRIIRDAGADADSLFTGFESLKPRAAPTSSEIAIRERDTSGQIDGQNSVLEIDECSVRALVFRRVEARPAARVGGVAVPAGALGYGSRRALASL